MALTREQAWELLNEYNKGEFHHTASHHGNTVFFIYCLCFFLHCHHGCLIFFSVIFFLDRLKFRLHLL